MKISALVLLITLATGIAVVQDPPTLPDPPGVKVLSNSWRREEVNLALLEDPMARNNSRSTAPTTTEQNSNMLPANRLIVPTTPKGPRVRRNSGGLRVRYLYEIKVLNSGAETIRMLTWDFDLFDPGTGRAVGHHSFTSKRTIRTGQTANLVARTRSHPITIVDAEAADDSDSKYRVRVTINRIEYEDGKAWVRPVAEKN